MTRGKRGLSLLELLVALALLAVITVGLITTTSLGVRLLDRTQEISKNQNEIALRIRLRSWIKNISSPTLLSNIPSGMFGTDRRLSFNTFAATPFHGQAAAMNVVLEQEGSDLTMALSFLDDVGSVLDQDRRVLLRDVTELKISYFDGTQDQPNWITEWSEETRLPQLIRITANQGTTPPWPEFTIAPILYFEN